MARLTVGLVSAVSFGALSALAGASAVGVDTYLGLSLVSLALFGAALLLPVGPPPPRVEGGATSRRTRPCSTDHK
jgi:hypothetical protein